MEALKSTRSFAELDEFAEILKQEGVRSYLEIGSDHGESLERIASFLTAPAKLVAVDVGAAPRLIDVLAALRTTGHDAHLIVGDSTNLRTIARVVELGPFDACFIDANHALPFVTADWNNYGPLCRVVGFHDIGWQPNPRKRLIEVPQLWESIKDNYRHLEIRKYSRKYGIGVLWPQASKS